MSPWIKRLVCRLALLLMLPICVIDSLDRKWWWRRFKNGTL